SGVALIVLLLLVSLIRMWLARSVSTPTAPANLAKDIRKKLGATTTNRGLRAWRWLFALAAIGAFSFHVYWARYAPETNQKLQELNYKDLRNRRLTESTLRGWIYDRKERPLADYEKDNNGNIVRDYPMDSVLAHIFGSERGAPGLERALFGTESDYDVPGSTVKTVMMYTGLRDGMQNIRISTSGGVAPGGCGGTIADDDDSCEAGGNIGTDVGYQKSSNIYFSYLGTQLGGEK